MTISFADEIFWQVHSGLPREAPGSDPATLQAFAIIPDLPPNPRILDVGCGPGAQTIALARACPQASITAVDTRQPFLDELARRAGQAGVAGRIQTLNVSMFNLNLDERFDLIWSEGAIYIIGFEAGLRQWKGLLKPRGCIAVTEISWLKPNPPDEIPRFWQEAYPGMADIEENLGRVRAAGYQSPGHFILPQSAWWDNYYHPMEKGIYTTPRRSVYWTWNTQRSSSIASMRNGTGMCFTRRRQRSKTRARKRAIIASAVVQGTAEGQQLLQAVRMIERCREFSCQQSGKALSLLGSSVLWSYAPRITAVPLGKSAHD